MSLIHLTRGNGEVRRERATDDGVCCPTRTFPARVEKLRCALLESLDDDGLSPPVADARDDCFSTIGPCYAVSVDICSSPLRPSIGLVSYPDLPS